MSVSGISGVDRLVRPGPPPRGAVQRTALVVESGPDGVYVTPLRGDTRTKLGPCRGGWYRDVGQCLEPAHDHPWQRVPVGSLVLLVTGADRPWITAWELPGQEGGGG